MYRRWWKAASELNHPKSKLYRKNGGRYCHMSGYRRKGALSGCGIYSQRTQMRQRIGSRMNDMLNQNDGFFGREPPLGWSRFFTARMFRINHSPPPPSSNDANKEPGPGTGTGPEESTSNYQSNTEYFIDPITLRRIPKERATSQANTPPPSDSPLTNTGSKKDQPLESSADEEHGPKVHFRTSEPVQDRSPEEDLADLDISETQKLYEDTHSPLASSKPFITENLGTASENMVDSREVKSESQNDSKPETGSSSKLDPSDLISGLKKEAPRAKKQQQQQQQSSSPASTTTASASASTTQPPPEPHPVDSQTSPGPDIDHSNVNKLEEALKKLNELEKKHEEEEFRLKKAFDYSWEQSHSQRPKSLERSNFFTSSKFEQPVPKSDHVKEYAILTPSLRVILTKTLPFKSSAPPKDLFETLSTMADPGKYVRSITKLEKNGWTCIGGGGPGELLVFERKYSPMRKYTKQGVRLTLSFIGIIGVSAAIMVMIA